MLKVKNRIVDTEWNGCGTKLDEMIQTIHEQNIVPAEALNDFFWDLFIADALIANWDRHNVNWGFLYNENTDAIKIAPVWGCGSVLNSQNVNGKGIRDFEFISSGKYPECTKALERMYPKINLDRINQIIDNTGYITDEEKEFYKTMIRMRKERILDFSYEKLVLPYTKT